jgi:uncharacterized protein (DUF58 family)
MRLHVWWMPVVALILFILQQIISSRPLMALWVITAGMWLVSFFWARSLAAGLRVEREHRYGWGQVGDVFEERVTLRNEGLFPAIWLLIDDRSTLTGHSIGLGTGIGGRSRRSWMMRTTCSRRGAYQLGPTIIESGDLFGLYRVRVEYSDLVDFVVSPPVVNLPMDLQITSGYLLHDHRFARRLTERSSVSASTREFTSGDSLLRIHWLTTARRDEPFVRHYENIHASDSCWIVLDLDRGAHPQAESLEHAIILALSVADRTLKTGLAVGILGRGDRLLLLPPAKGVEQFQRIQRALATIQSGNEPLGELLLRFWPHLHDEHNLTVITPSRQTDWINNLTLLSRSHLRPSVLLLGDRRDSFSRSLARRGIKAYAVPSEIFDSPEAAPGKRGSVEWRFTPMGRAIKVVEGESQ